MGQSTDAILCYGIQLGDDEGGPEPFSPEWKKAQQEDDWEENDEEEDGYFDFEDMIVDSYAPDLVCPDEYSKEYYDARRKVLEEVGIALETHCSGEYPMYILCIKASITTASRGYPHSFATLPVANSEWNSKLLLFCERFGVTPPNDPEWVLCSYWG